MNSLRSVIVSLTVFLLKFRNCLVFHLVIFSIPRGIFHEGISRNIFFLFFSLNIFFRDFLRCIFLRWINLLFHSRARHSKHRYNRIYRRTSSSPVNIFCFHDGKLGFSCFFSFFWNDNKRWLHVWRHVRFRNIGVFRLEPRGKVWTILLENFLSYEKSSRYWIIFRYLKKHILIISIIEISRLNKLFIFWQ